MHIGIFTDAFYPQVNGIVISIISLASNMAERGHKVTIVAPSQRKLEEISIPGVTIKRIPSISASFYDGFKWTNPLNKRNYKILKKEHFDLIHFMTPVFISMIGIKVGRINNIPVVGTFHTFIADPHYYEHLCSGAVKVTEEIVWTYLNLYYNHADYVTAPTKEATRIIRENGCTSSMEAISNGIDLRQFDNSKADRFKAQYGLKDKVILYVGRISIEKNIDILLRAFKIIYKNDPETQLLLVGDGPQKENLEESIKTEPFADSIIFTGTIEHRDLVNSGIFASVALFATASVTETQGITILEAQANSLPCVGPSEGGILDMIENGVNGLLVRPNDAEDLAKSVLTILNDENLKKDMGTRAREIAESHSMEKIIDRWEGLYSELIANKDALPEKDYLHFKEVMDVARTFKVDIKYIISRLWFSRFRRPN